MIETFPGALPIAASLQTAMRDPSRDGAPRKDGGFVIATAKPTRTLELRNKQGKPYTVQAREFHPDYAAFNNAPADRRTSVTLTLVSSTWTGRPGGAIDSLYAGELPGKVRCYGNGRTAQRGSGDAYNEIPCPGEGCEYRASRQNGRRVKPRCQPRSWLRGSLTWRDGSPLPAALVEFRSGSPQTLESMVGIRDAVAAAAADAGLTLDDVPPRGLRVRLAIEKRRRSDGKSYAVVVASMVGTAAEHVARFASTAGAP